MQRTNCRKSTNWMENSIKNDPKPISLLQEREKRGTSNGINWHSYILKGDVTIESWHGQKRRNSNERAWNSDLVVGTTSRRTCLWQISFSRSSGDSNDSPGDRCTPGKKHRETRHPVLDELLHARHPNSPNRNNQFPETSSVATPT